MNSDLGRTDEDTRRVYQTHSDDDGLTWLEAKEIISIAKDPAWWGHATVPGIGIQLQKGFSAYSSLVKLADSSIGLLFEKDKDIVFARFSIDQIK